jgi:hypothetical protein
VKSRTTRRYRKAYSRLPIEVRRRAGEAYRRFAADPFSPGLDFKQVHATQPYWSVRVGLHHRAVGVRDRDDVVWFWIGSHADYDDLISRL